MLHKVMRQGFDIVKGAVPGPLMGLLLLCAALPSAFAQSVSHHVVSSGGDHYQAGGIEVSITIGETLTETDQGAWGRLHRGFHQLYQTRGIIFDTICEGSSLFGYTATGIYEDVFTLPGGIDSIRILDLTVIPAIVVGSTVTNVSCFGGADGSITLNVTGGLPPFTYEWSDGSGDDVLTGLSAGNYLVIVNDAFGCQGLGNIPVTQPPVLAVSAAITDVTCIGESDGSIALTVTGGVTDYTFSWSGSEDTQEITGLEGGSYAVTVTDANGCEVAGNYPVSEPDELFLSVTVNDAGCPGATDGSIILQVSGGTAPYEVEWSTGAFSPNLLDVGAGEYDVTVTDANGCSENLVSLQVNEGNVPPIAPGPITGETLVCAGSQVQFSIDPVPNTDTYVWVLPPGWSGSSTGNSITATAGTAAGTVSVSAVNVCGISSAQTLQVGTIPAHSALSGTVTFLGEPVTSGWVFTYTEILQATGYQKADSVPIVNGQYSFPTLPLYPASFIIKAVAGPGHPGAVATFYATNGMSHQWDNPALNYSLFSVCGESQVRDIQLIVEEIAQEEPGFATLKGQVRWNDGKVEAEDPIPLIDVVLERVPPGGSAFAMDQTDEEGRYEFAGVPAIPEVGFFYRIYVSIPGIPMSDTYVLVVTSTDTLIEDLDFIVDTIANLIYPVGDSTLIGIDDDVFESLGNLVLMPNPMADRMTVRMPIGFRAVRYRISDISGVLVREVRLDSPDGVFTVQRGTMAAGMQILEVFSADGRRLAVRFIVR